MPTYEYLCQNCRKRFEVFQKMNDPAVQSCPFCQGKVERIINGGSGLIFKGHGFYITDYKKENAPKDEKKSEKKEAA